MSNVFELRPQTDNRPDQGELATVTPIWAAGGAVFIDGLPLAASQGRSTPAGNYYAGYSELGEKVFCLTVQALAWLYNLTNKPNI